MKKAFIVYLLLTFLFLSGTTISAQEQKDASRWERHLEFSYIITTGNTDSANMSTRLDVAKEGDKNRYFLKGNALYGEENGEETKNKWSLTARWERIFTKRLFGFLSTDYIKDKFSGYDYRIGCGPGLGYDIVKTKKHNLKGLISLLYYFDRFSDQSASNKSSDNYLSGKSEIDYTWEIMENLTFDQTVDFLISFEDIENERHKKFFIDSETELKVRVNKHISLGVSYIVAYQNLLLTDVKNRTDVTFLTSLIIDF